jgi:hypothetical protein
MTLSLLLALASPAQAFCGAYVGDVGSTPKNGASRIAIAREGTSTTLTMFNDVDGDYESFGLIVPVPEVLHEEDVRRIDRELLGKAASYSAPRLVAYTCEDLYPLEHQDTGWGGSGTSGVSWGCGVGPQDLVLQSESYDDGGVADSGGVVVEDQFDLGEYTVYVLSAEGADGLSAWLDNNGFSVPDTTAPVLQEYIDRGDYFLALRVDLDRAPDSGFLSPLQFTYTAEQWTLPIRLGATSSTGVQDLTLFLITPPESGRVGISNYPETALPEDECMVDADDVGAYYDEQLERVMNLPATPDTLAGRSGLSWVTEYSWTGGSCDPCPSEGPLTPEEAMGLGLQAHYGFHFTRLHLRYTPDAVPADIALYTTGIVDNDQVRYIQHQEELESDIAICGGEVPDDPGSCFTADWWGEKAQGNVSDEVPLTDGAKGCAGAAILLLVPVFVGARRRR